MEIKKEWRKEMKEGFREIKGELEKLVDRKIEERGKK